MMISPAVVKAFSAELQKMASLEKEDVKKVKRQLELWKNLSAKSPVKIRIDPEAHAHGGGYFDQEAKEIGLTHKDSDALAHELGHASLDKEFLGRLIQHPVGRSLFPWTPVAGALGGVLMAKGKKMGLLLPVVTAGPTLLAEWLATGRGAKKLEEAGATPEEIKQFRKNLKTSYSTYTDIAPPTVLAGGLGAIAAGL